MRKIFAAILLIFILTSCTRIGVSPVTTGSSAVTETTTETATATETTETILQETATPEKTTVPETTAPETDAVPETTTTPETTVPETTTAAETTTPETTVPTTTVPTTTTPETTIPTTTTPTTTTPTVTSPVIFPVSYNTLNFPEQRGVWISYLEYDSILENKTKEQFTENINRCFDNIASLGFNTVYIQLRAFGDSYYNSEYFPKAEGVNFDPLPVMISSAHDRGLSVHGWINPMRLCLDTEMKNIPDEIIYKKWYKSGTNDIFKTGGRWYLNPDSDEAINLIISGVAEIASGYAVDGIQIDDYFYPDENPTPLKVSRVNNLVKSIYNTVHKANPDALFGISPQGNIENNTMISADVREWCGNSGYCDYIVPQVYFGFENGYSPYLQMISEWSSICSDVKLVIGLSPYKIGLYDTYAKPGVTEWQDNTDILARQIKAAKLLSNYGGVAMFRYDSLFNPSRDVSRAVNAEIENLKKEF